MNSPLVQSPAYLPRKIPTSAFSLRWSPPRRARHFAQLHTWLTGENLLNRSNSSAGQNRSKTKSTTNFNLCLNAITATNFSGIIATSSGRTSHAKYADRWFSTGPGQLGAGSMARLTSKWTYPLRPPENCTTRNWDGCRDLWKVGLRLSIGSEYGPCF